MKTKRIHKEGWTIIGIVFIILIVLNLINYAFVDSSFINTTILILSILFILFVLRFFRIPHRNSLNDDSYVISPADGEVVVIEEVYEDEYLKTKCIQVSVFMSVWNIHINWAPISGVVKYYKYHPGKYLIAKHPKSSALNERTSIGIKTTENIDILVRQIAGFVARRVVSFAKIEKELQQSQEIGFIKFGSRVDVFLPLDSEILVKPGDKVIGTISKLALLK